MTSDYGLWVEMVLVLGVGAGVIVALAAGAARATRSAVWQRTFWQVATVALALLCLAQWTGMSGAMVSLWRAPRLMPDQAQGLSTGGFASEQPAEPVERRPTAPASESSAIPAGSAGPGRAHASRLGPRDAQGEGIERTARVALPATGLGALASVSGHALDSASGSIASSASAARATATPESPMPSPSWHSEHGRWLGVVWGIGTVLLLCRAGWARVALWRFRQRQRSTSDEAVQHRVARLAQRLGIRREVAVLEAAGLPGPVALGTFRPAVVLPAGFGRRFDASQQQAMLAHELGHVAAWDSAWLGLADLVAALLWWHPLAWWSRRCLRRASEAVADEASLLVPEGPSVLAACLVALGRRLARPQLGWLSVQGPHFRSGLGLRVERLLRLSSQAGPVPGRRPLGLARLALVIALVVVSVSCTAWAMPRANALEGGTMMNMLVKSWRQSLAGALLAAVLAPGPATAGEERDRPRDPDRPAARELRERPRPEAEVRELMERRQALEQKGAEIKRRLESLKPDQDAEANELRAKLEAIERELRELPKGPRDAPPRERLKQRLEEIGRAMQRAKEAGRHEEFEALQREGRELKEALLRDAPPQEHPRIQRRLEELREAMQRAREAGRHEEVERLEREAHELKQALQRGREPREPEGPPPPERIRRRLAELREAVHRAKDEGRHDDAERLEREGRELMQALRRGPEGPPREGPPPIEQMERTIHELRQQVMELRHQMEEMREHLKRLSDERRHER